MICYTFVNIQPFVMSQNHGWNMAHFEDMPWFFPSIALLVELKLCVLYLYIIIYPKMGNTLIVPIAITIKRHRQDGGAQYNTLLYYYS